MWEENSIWESGNGENRGVSPPRRWGAAWSQLFGAMCRFPAQGGSPCVQSQLIEVVFRWHGPRVAGRCFHDAVGVDVGEDSSRS